MSVRGQLERRIGLAFYGALLVVFGALALVWVSTPATMVGDVIASTDREWRTLWFRMVGWTVVGSITLSVLFCRTLRNARRISVAIEQLRVSLNQLGAPIEELKLKTTGEVDDFRQLQRLVRGIGVFIRRTREAQAEIERAASEDTLTGALNRRGLLDQFSTHVFDQDQDEDVLIGLMHVDLDHFKTINDTMGHDAGDFVLKETTNRMRSVLRANDVLARIGGDEFVILVPGAESAMALGQLADEIVRLLQAPMVYGESVCRVGASIGIVVNRFGEVSGDDFDRLLIEADTALCHAKSAGRNRFVAFQPEMAREIHAQRDRAAEIRHGLLRDQFKPWFQPMVNVRTGALIGVEVLSRWEHPTRGVLRPKDFLNAAEAHNMIEEVGTQVLEQACLALSGWEQLGYVVPRLHINMRRGELIAPAIVDKFNWTLDDTNIDPAQIALEISELDCTGRSVDLIFANLKRFSDLGIAIVLDGFGAETGSAANLIRLGVRRMKCSRRLLEQSAEDPDQPNPSAMLRSAISLGASLDIAVVCKGIETDAQADAMMAEGFSEMQGDYYAPVMNWKETTQWLQERHSSSTGNRDDARVGG